MAFYSRAELRSGGLLRTAALGYATAEQELNLRTARVSPGERFDIFLSHSFKDAPLILGIVELLESQHISVYVDWIIDRQLDRSKVNAKTAALLRTRMGQCRSLIYATSTSSPSSKWMPWELGYFDGKKGRHISIMPIEESAQGTQGQEYLGLYPAIEKLPVRGGGYLTVAVMPGRREFQSVAKFAQGSDEFRGFDDLK